MFDELTREIVTPDDEQHWLQLRTKDITSTESAVLFGLSPYATLFELWHQKKIGEVVRLPTNERMTWGTRLQDAIAEGIAKDCGLVIRRMDEYAHLPNHRVAASFDFEIIGALPTSLYFREFQALGPGILEIKVVDAMAFRDTWTETEFGIEAPAHIELQGQQQMLCRPRAWAVIGALVGGNTVVRLLRHRDDRVCRGILSAVADFWKSIDANQAPAPDFRVDYETIKRVYGYAEPGKVFDARGNVRVGELLAIASEAGEREKMGKMDKDEAKAELLTIVGNHERIQHDKYNAFCGMVGPAEIKAFTRPGYRNVRITKKKES